MQLEGNALDKIGDIICTAYDVRIGGRGGRADGYSPFVRMIGRVGLALFFCQNGCSVAISNWTVYTQAL